ncbi:MAG: lipid-A-disaccharide synthase [Candidatus Melainabacteria bacterium]|nr:lipid-A-disaccharide synthase [Candidatus Melainabacteria bacterium]
MTASVDASSTAKEEGAKDCIFVCVGDISADKHVAKLVRHLKELQPHLKVFGIGGPEMAKAGVELMYNCQDFAEVGVVRLIRKVPRFLRIKKELLEAIEERKPRCALLVDFGGFNIAFSSAVRNRYKSLPIVYFISPQVWGSRPWRLNELARNVSKMLVIFPFEQAIYERKGIPARFVGHPLMAKPDVWDLKYSREEVMGELGLNPEKPLVAIFPGSRKQEIKDHMPVVAHAVKWMQRVRPDIQFVLSQSSEHTAALIGQQMHKQKLEAGPDKGLLLVSSEENYRLLSIADLVWAKSGTTTLETTLCCAPMIIFYRGDWLSFLLVLCFKTVKRVGWPNLLAGRELVPELIQLDCRAEKLVEYTLDLIDVPSLRQEMARELRALRDQLGQGDFAKNAALEILEIIGCRTA